MCALQLCQLYRKLCCFLVTLCNHCPLFIFIPILFLILFCAGQVLLVDRKLSASVYPRPGLMTNTSEVDAANPDLSKHPLFADAMPLVVCELRKGEMLYIPPLFWHHIVSLEVSFSVSFWWGKRRALSEVLPKQGKSPEADCI